MANRGAKSVTRVTPKTATTEVVTVSVPITSTAVGLMYLSVCPNNVYGRPM